MKTILCTFFACALFCAVDVRAQQTPPSGAAFIAVCKESMTLAVYDFNSCLRAVYPIACAFFKVGDIPRSLIPACVLGGAVAMQTLPGMPINNLVLPANGTPQFIVRETTDDAK